MKNRKTEGETRGSKVNMKDLLRFKSKSEESEDGLKVEIEVQGEEKSKSVGLLQSTRKKEQDVKKETEKREIIESYRVIYENQVKGSLVLANMIERSLKEAIQEYLKIELIDEIGLEENLDIDKGRLKLRERNMVRDRVMKSQNNLIAWITKDIVNKYYEKLSVLEDIDLSRVEVVRKIKFGENKITYTTDDGEYTFSSKEASKLGGYIVLETDVMLEKLNLRTMLKYLNRKKKSRNKENKYNSLMYLMVEPFIGRADNGKILVMTDEHLRLALYSQREFSKSKEAEIMGESRSSIRDLKYGKGATEVDIMREDKRRRVQLIRRITEDLKEPQRENMYVIYPYNLLEKTGIEFELDYDVKDGAGYGLRNIWKLEQSFVEFNSLKKLSKVKKEINLIKDKEKYVNADVNKLALNNLKEFYEGIMSFAKEEDLNRIFKLEGIESIDQVSEDILKELFDIYYAYYIMKINIGDKIRRGAIQDSIINVDKLDKDRNNLVMHTKEVESNGRNFFRKFMNLDLNDILDIGINLNTDIDLNLNPIYYENLLKALEEYIIEIDDWVVDMYTYYNKNISIADIREDSYVLQPYWNEHESILKERVDEIQKVYDYLKEEIEKYKEIINKNYTINSYINRNKPDSIKEIEVEVDLGTKVDFSGIIYRNIFNKKPYKSELEFMAKYPVPNVRMISRANYQKLRNIYIHLTEKGIPIDNWIEIAKLFTPNSMKYYSLIRVVPEITELINLESIRGDISYINELNKFRKIDENSSWEKVESGITGALPELSENEFKLNELISDVIENHIGMMVALDMLGLAEYIGRTAPSMWTGVDLVKYIPIPQIVEKYFPIVPFEEVGKLGDNLLKEINYAPPTKIAIKEIFNTCSEYIKSYGKEEINEIANDILKVNEKYLSISELKSRDREKELEVVKGRLEDFNNRYEEFYKVVNSNLNTITNPYIIYDIETEDSFEKVHAEIRNIIIDTPNVVRHYIDEYEMLNRFYEKVKLKYKLAKKELTRDIVQETHEKVRELEEQEDILGDKVNDFIENLESILKSQYDRDATLKQLQVILTQLNLSYFRASKVLLNYIKTMTDQMPDMLAAAYMKVAVDHLIRLRDDQVNPLFDNAKSKLEQAEHLYPTVMYIFGLSSQLELTESDRNEALDKIQAEYDSDEYKLKKTQEEMNALKDLSKLLEGVTEDVYPDIIKDFPRAHLLSDEHYESIRYPSILNFEKMYPDFYVDDFTLAENIKIRQALGLEINQEHLDDERLMDIVSRLILNEEVLEYYK